MDTTNDSLAKDTIVEIGTAASSRMLQSLLLSVGAPVPQTVTNVAGGIFARFVSAGVGELYSEFKRRQLSALQSGKVDKVFKVAYETFCSLVGENDWNMDAPDAEDYLRNLYEVEENVVFSAMNEGQQKKISVLGHFLGRSIYSGRKDWDTLQHYVSLIDKLTWRQLVLVKLIKEQFPGCDRTLSVMDASSNVELAGLLQYGFWSINGATFGTNHSGAHSVSMLPPTEFCNTFYEDVMLDASVTDADVCRVVESLHLKCRNS